MDLQAYVIKGFEMHRDDLKVVIGDLKQSELEWRPSPGVNPIGFLIWHMSRVEDGWIQRVIQGEKHLWVRTGWAQRFGMPEDQRDMGYDYNEDQVREFKSSSLALLTEYFDAVRGGTLEFLAGWDASADTAQYRAPWGGTISTGDILAQLTWELNQHAGQVSYLRGLQRGLQRPDYMGPLSLAS